MDESEWLAQQFEGHRSHLKGVRLPHARLIGRAEDAVQEGVAATEPGRHQRGAQPGRLAHDGGRRVCLDRLRPHVPSRGPPRRPGPDPVVTPEGEASPEHEAELADSVGLALLVVLDTLPPGELAFVLRDMFAVPFEE